MAGRNYQEHPEHDGMMHKAATLEQQAVTDEDMALINQLAPSELSAEDVFTFKAVLCDNKTDRQFDRFTDRKSVV